jgi:hypothetical protein
VYDVNIYSKRLIHDDIGVKSVVQEMPPPNSRKPSRDDITIISGVEEIEFWLNFQFRYALLMWFVLFLNTQNSVYFKLISH